MCILILQNNVDYFFIKYAQCSSLILELNLISKFGSTVAHLTFFDLDVLEILAQYRQVWKLLGQINLYSTNSLKMAQREVMVGVTLWLNSVCKNHSLASLLIRRVHDLVSGQLQFGIVDCMVLN